MGLDSFGNFCHAWSYYRSFPFPQEASHPYLFLRIKHVCKKTVHWYQSKAQDKSCSPLEESLALDLSFNMKENFHLDSATVCTSPPGLSKNWWRNGVERLCLFSLSCHFSISKHMTSVYSRLRLSPVFQDLTWWSCLENGYSSNALSFSKLSIMTEIITPSEKDFSRSHYLCSQYFCLYTLHP